MNEKFRKHKKKKKKFSKLIENTVAGIMTILKVN